jgi:hypothetical protein
LKNYIGVCILENLKKPESALWKISLYFAFRKSFQLLFVAHMQKNLQNSPVFIFRKNFWIFFADKKNSKFLTKKFPRSKLYFNNLETLLPKNSQLQLKKQLTGSPDRMPLGNQASGRINDPLASVCVVSAVHQFATFSDFT